MIKHARRSSPKKLRLLLTLMIGGVWVFHGLYSKILGGIPRHRLIVEKVLGPEIGGSATIVIGILEVLLGIWVFSGRKRWLCAAAQTVAIAGMNALEIALARELLISPPGMVVLNCAFLSAVWVWASTVSKNDSLRA